MAGFAYAWMPADGSAPLESRTATRDGFGQDTNGIDVDALPPQVLASLGVEEEEEVERFVLLRPSNEGQHIFVSMYGGPELLGGSGALPNRRATALAMECGFYRHRLYGDVCVGRLHRKPGSLTAVVNVDFAVGAAKQVSPASLPGPRNLVAPSWCIASSCLTAAL